MPFGAADAQVLQQGVKPPRSSAMSIPSADGAEDADALAVERLRELDGRLPAEGHDDADGLLHVDDLQHVLGRERLEIQAVGSVVVRGDSLRVVVDDDDVIAHGLERPHAVDGRIVKLDALADADGPGAEHHDDGLAAAREGARLAARVRAGVEIRRLRVKFGGAGVDHLVARAEGGAASRCRTGGAVPRPDSRGTCRADKAPASGRFECLPRSPRGFAAGTKNQRSIRVTSKISSMDTPRRSASKMVNRR